MLKEQDPMIELIREWIMSPVDESAGLHLSVLEVFQVVEEMIAEHVTSPENSRLKKYLPKVKKIFLPLELTRAVHEYDARTHFLARKRVPPTFKEVRHILNLATINAIAAHLKLVTFDADDTIYEDGGTISANSGMVSIIVQLLQRGLVVSLVTAAGYPNGAAKYEQRLRGILEGLEPLTTEERARFLVMGGECNYLFGTHTHPDTGKVSLRAIDGKLWKDGRGVRWQQEDITTMLDLAEKTLRETTQALQMPIEIMRKERAVGILNPSTTKRFSYENLEEICLTVQHALKDCTVPHCAFNGGNDVWVDVGNKALGIQALQKFVFRFLPNELSGGSEELSIIEGMECLHVGDRFTRTGNDTRSRDAATTVWISDPRETVYIMKKLIKAIDRSRGTALPASVLDQHEATVEAAIKAGTKDSINVMDAAQ
ncbi:TPA: hypothetical protein N0F65_012482 [Lagenidium giganteum]|uniref:IMP-specific 5'-nucleotidase 1 n=1 Tax=Lagenidium giganteum TaxID=4803 RepID=A0AAV2YRN9_9STRA|nr:TPA: hypothetical protein N0F65_012482 [Lagenidium giganteum]